LRLRRKQTRSIFTVELAKRLFDGSVGKQALDTIVREGFATKDYFVDGCWVSSIQDGIRGSRYKVNDTLSLIQDAANLWRYIKKDSIQKPVGGVRIPEQLLRVKFQGERLVLFSPWGPRYNQESPLIEKSDPEVRTFGEIQRTLATISGFGYDISFILMPADMYGIEINNFSPLFVNEYFKRVEELAFRELSSAASVDIKRWSRIREDNTKRYSQLREEIDETLFDQIKKSKFRNAVKVARVFNPTRAEESARRYCIERLVEGILIEELYSPIKLSIVRKEKDTLDGPLKRVYLMSNKAPWLGGK